MNVIIVKATSCTDMHYISNKETKAMRNKLKNLRLFICMTEIVSVGEGDIHFLKMSLWKTIIHHQGLLHGCRKAHRC